MFLAASTKTMAREVDSGDCLSWSEQMECLGGPAQPPPTHRALPETRRNHTSLDSTGDPR
jgi:hypothetical protein